MNVKNFQWYRSVPWFLQELGYQDLMNPMHLYHVMPSLCPNMILNHQLVCLLFFVEQAGSLCVLRAYLAAFRCRGGYRRGARGLQPPLSSPNYT